MVENMRNYKYSLKKRIGNILFIGYISLYIVLRILHIHDYSIMRNIIFVVGEVMGFGIKIMVIIVFWQTIMIRYIKKNNRINIIQLVVGVFLIMLALSSITTGFIETYIVISIVIILKKNYHIFTKTNNINN